MNHLLIIPSDHFNFHFDCHDNGLPHPYRYHIGINDAQISDYEYCGYWGFGKMNLA